jgi:hypothetical protein
VSAAGAGRRAFEAVDVHLKARFAGDLAGEFDRQAIGVIQMEGHLGGDAVAALGSQPRDLAP